MSADIRTKRPCDTCAASAPEPLFELNGWPIGRCRQCGLIYVTRLPTGDELTKAYGKGYFAGDVYADYVGERDRRTIAARVRENELRKYILSGDLLEIGAAAGFFLDVARAHFRVVGVEYSEFAANFAQHSLGLDVRVGDIAEASLADGSFDAVVMWDTIEHLVSPRRTLQEAARVLRPGGILSVSTGDAEAVRGPLNEWRHILPPWHLSYFGRGTLEALLRRCHFEPFHFARTGQLPDWIPARLGHHAYRFGFGDEMIVYAQVSR